MAKLVGLIQLQGSLGNLSFCKTQFGTIVRMKNTRSKKEIMTHPKYTRVRENMAEFTRGIQATKLFKSVFKSVVTGAHDSGVSNRLMSLMMKVIHADQIAPRGQRTARNGNPMLLQGFEFNKRHSLRCVMGVMFSVSVDRATGTVAVDFPVFSPSRMISAPMTTSHFRLVAAIAVIDFEGNHYDLTTAESALISMGQAQGPLQLSLAAQPSPHPLFVALAVEFLEVIGGVEHPVCNGVYNPMAIVATTR